MNPTAVLEAGLKQALNENLGALAGIQGSILSAAGSREVRSILVTSCHRQEGKTFAAVGMAHALASHAGTKVLLVDTNFAAPALHERYNVAQGPGLTDLLAGTAALEDVVHPTEAAGLMLMTLGTSATPLFDITRTGVFAERLASLRGKFDCVICDGSAVFSSSDASLTAGCFDGVVLLVECERTRWEVVQDARERLTRAGGTILGVALNRRRYYIPKAIYAAG